MLITGAAGFVGSAVAEMIARDPSCLGTQIIDLVLSDLTTGDAAGRWLAGDLADPSYISTLLADRIDVLLHLASVPGRMVEEHPDLGRAVNLSAPMALLEGLAQQSIDRGVATRVVFASSIAVLGALGPDTVDETYPATPLGMYGTHKHNVEGRIASLSRENKIDGVSLRLPGIVARPANAAGFGSAFMSDLFHHAATGQAYRCPVSKDATAWWMSCATAVANILHAARMETSTLAPDRMVLLPALYASIGDLISGLEDYYGKGAAAHITFDSDDKIEALFGRFPEINNTTALRLGFEQDTSVATLIEAVDQFTLSA